LATIADKKKRSLKRNMVGLVPGDPSMYYYSSPISKTSGECKNENVCEKNILESVKSRATFSHPCLQETERERERETECTDLHTGFYAWFKFALIGKRDLPRRVFQTGIPACAVWYPSKLVWGRASGNAHKTQHSTTENQ
jgi:hypothetical protein